MYKILLVAFAILTLSGCVSPIALQEQTPTPEYNNAAPILISVIDNRKKVKEGKPETFVGRVHATFGIPVDWDVDTILATEKDDKSLTLSQWLQKRIVKGLTEKGWQVKPADFKTVPTETIASYTLTEQGSQHLLVLDLQEWFFSINLNWVSSFNFDTNVDTYLFDKDSGLTYQHNTQERDVIDEKADESPQNNVLRAYHDQLLQILSDPALKAQIQEKAQTQMAESTTTL
ncbi:hypothetical protein CXF83_18320 [Shewanella sp. Choline-02u-19]|uniref:hypothetical protein n=1 Tax=unclassified Shewanella TaxID=196818 RepID=UPI000C32309D|nr:MULTISPECIES: hypothetical protein [unclassified Shewanella]PKG56634.1 hypothetical protein CXF82_13535 [Shewanella sp. GutDb-MelDb]PKH54464.1 hypothetical protein CXF84_19525 [Shewanella sp. Bg11-22]PKI28521.1 hypothetical protein CXF83_18320 [Shewanella sp. Choline-02u-19]